MAASNTKRYKNPTIRSKNATSVLLQKPRPKSELIMSPSAVATPEHNEQILIYKAMGANRNRLSREGPL